jgi:glucose-6-phosphate isomerase
MSEVEAAAGLAVRGADAVPGSAEARQSLTDASVPGLLVEKDPTLWGPAAESEAEIRLGWVDTYRRSTALLPVLAELRGKLSGLNHVVLAGMGGSSLAPEVIARTLGIGLTVLDTTDPHQVRAALADRLDTTVVVVSSKSGSTVETDSHRRAYWQAFEDSGVADIWRRFVIVTDPGSAREDREEMGAHDPRFRRRRPVQRPHRVRHGAAALAGEHRRTAQPGGGVRPAWVTTTTTRPGAGRGTPRLPPAAATRRSDR